MKIIMGNDHSATKRKDEIKKYLQDLGHKVFDVGTNVNERVNYNDFGKKAIEKFSNDSFDRLIVICGSGVGIAQSVNKNKDGNCALVNSIASVKKAKNLLDTKQFSLGARVTTFEVAKQIVDEVLK